MNKFYAKAKIDKDGTNVAKHRPTNVKPYKSSCTCLQCWVSWRPGMEVVDVTLAQVHKQEHRSR